MSKAHSREEAMGWFLKNNTGTLTCVDNDREIEATHYPEAEDFFINKASGNNNNNNNNSYGTGSGAKKPETKFTCPDCGCEFGFKLNIPRKEG